MVQAVQAEPVVADNNNNLQPTIEILEQNNLILRFRLTHASSAIANAIRRVILADTECMAINRVEIHENTTMLHDGLIAERLGLIPLISHASNEFKNEAECTCDDGCPNCEAEFTLHMKNNGDDLIDVTDQHMKCGNAKVYPASRNMKPFVMPPNAKLEIDAKMNNEKNNNWEDLNLQSNAILIVQLAKNQEISFTATASKGCGRNHAKWNPVAVAAYKPEPILTLNQPMLSQLSLADKEFFVKSCPARVFSLNPTTQTVEIEDSNRCTWCKDCFEASGRILQKNKQNYKDPKLSLVEDGASESNFIFAIESTGCLPPEAILDRALETLCTKLIAVVKRNREVMNEDFKNQKGK